MKKSIELINSENYCLGEICDVRGLRRIGYLREWLKDEYGMGGREYVKKKGK